MVQPKVRGFRAGGAFLAKVEGLDRVEALGHVRLHGVGVAGLRQDFKN